MGLFSLEQLDTINRLAVKSTQSETVKKSTNIQSINADLNRISNEVVEYFKDSPAILISTKEELHEYISKCIEVGYVGIDTETTGLDRVYDTIVGASLYYPGGVECYIPNKHLVPIFDTPYKNQLSYEEMHDEFQRLADSDVKLIFANADFDLAMMYKDYKVDFNDNCYYDVILAWRCLKENEKDNALKVLYNKYYLHGKGDPKKFSDFFSVQLFPYCKPEIAKLYAANDAKITYELFTWQLHYVTKSDPKCQKAHLESISDLVWNVEFPLIEVCQNMHRTGIYFDKNTAVILKERYNSKLQEELGKLSELVDQAIVETNYTPKKLTKAPFLSGADFNPNSPPHVKHLLYDILQIPSGKSESTNKEVLTELNLPVTNQILKVRSLRTLISTFVEKLPNSTTSDSRIHARFNSVGADTGRLSSSDPNLMNLPSHATDIRHLFRATPKSKINIDCEIDSNNITVSLPRYYSVTLHTGETKKVEDIIVGDDIKLLEDGKEVYRIVKNISDSGGDPSLCDVIF